MPATSYVTEYSPPPRDTTGGGVGVETSTQKRVKSKSTRSLWELWGMEEAISEVIPAAEPEPAPEPASESVPVPPPEQPEPVQQDEPAPALELVLVEEEPAEPPEPAPVRDPVYRRKKKLLPRSEKYAISSLKLLAAKKFTLECELWWNHRDFIHAAREVYSSTLDHDRGLRDVVVQTIREHRELLHSGEVKSVLRDTLLAYDLLMAICL
ncbi:hypothetical protein DL768_009876 [Monosporascus sp. mg162]|nr:hypothetical protein DL768_009876 [Monosporascus sp. mg162]